MFGFVKDAVVDTLEEKTGKDIDGDGHVGPTTVDKIKNEVGMAALSASMGGDSPLDSISSMLGGGKD